MVFFFLSDSVTGNLDKKWCLFLILMKKMKILLDEGLKLRDWSNEFQKVYWAFLDFSFLFLLCLYLLFYIRYHPHLPSYPIPFHPFLPFHLTSRPGHLIQHPAIHGHHLPINIHILRKKQNRLRHLLVLSRPLGRNTPFTFNRLVR